MMGRIGPSAFLPGVRRSPLAGGGAREVDLSGRLPGSYLRDGGVFLPLAETVLEVLDLVAGAIRAEAGAWTGPEGGPEDHPPAAGEATARPSGHRAGTAGELVRAVAGGAGAPAVWHGVWVRPSGRPGELEIVCTDTPSAVIAWPAGATPAAAIPDGVRPAGVPVSAVRLAGPAPCPAIAGDRFLGEVMG